MRILRRDRSGDLKGANSPYRLERVAFWTWFWLCHPIGMTFGRQVTVGIRLTADYLVSVLYVYGNFEIPAYSGIQFQGAYIEGDADSLRRLAALLIDRAERVEAVQQLLDAGTWPHYDDVTAFPAGFEDEVDWEGRRLGNAPLAGREAGAP